jgi:serine/threonine protein kinase
VRQAAPDWWVKIGDFGISKRAEQGVTELRTAVGTSGYLAPEVIGIMTPEDFSHADDKQGSWYYTSAVDVWALGQIIFIIVTGATAFQEATSLSRYVMTGKGFPRDKMTVRGISPLCCDFVESLMAPSPRLRPTAIEASVKPWLRNMGEVPGYIIPNR